MSSCPATLFSERHRGWIDSVSNAGLNLHGIDLDHREARLIEPAFDRQFQCATFAFLARPLLGTLGSNHAMDMNDCSCLIENDVGLR